MKEIMRENMKEKMQERSLNMLNSFAISFTAVMVLYPFFSSLGIFLPINNTLMYQILTVCFGVALVQELTLMLPVKSILLHNFVQLLDVYAVVMVLGAGVFRWFPMSVWGFIIPGIFCVIIFVLVWMVLYLSAYRKVQEINQIIQGRQ